MTRTIDKTGRIYISQKWLQYCTDSSAVITVDDGALIIHPYDPKKHDLGVLLYRRLDDHARIKIPPDIIKVLGFSIEERCHLYISQDNTAMVRKLGDYCDVCGQKTETTMVLDRNICPSCFEKLKRSE